MPILSITWWSRARPAPLSPASSTRAATPLPAPSRRDAGTAREQSEKTTRVVARGEARGWLLGGLQKTGVTQALLSPGSCPGDTFTCLNTQCVRKENPECDGQKDCADASDERGCGESLAAGLLDVGHGPQPAASGLDSYNSTGLLGTKESQGHGTACQANRCLHQDEGNCTLGTPWSPKGS